MKTRVQIAITAVLLGAGLMVPDQVQAHCDTMDGPVVISAKTALDKKDIAPVLKWVKEDGEAEVKAAFQKTLAVRTKGTEARELADQFFFETVVRIHRQGEDAPYTGLKPAGAHADPAIEKADQALRSGDINPALNLITSEATEGIRKRFAHVREKQKHAEESVDAGREYVEAYVDYIHYLEGLFEAAHRNKPHEH